MKKILSWLLTMAIMVSMASFAIAEGDAAVTVLDFEDGNFAFLGLSMAKGNADKATLSVVDYNGSKALKVEGTGKVPYVAFNVDGLLGENITKLASVTFDVGVDAGSDGKFYAVSGKTYAYAGAELTESSDDWSVYLARSNPKGAKAVLDESFIAGAGNNIVISKETDNAQTKLGTPVAFYLDNIRFLDADGNALALDTSAVYADATVEADLSNLLYLTDAVEFANTASAGGWSQATLDSGADIIAALEPGKVIAITFESEDNTMWTVFPDSAAGWTRLGNDGKATIQGGVAYIPYEMIVEALGEDKTAWGARVQAEAKTPWSAYSVSVGTLVKADPRVAE